MSYGGGLDDLHAMEERLMQERAEVSPPMPPLLSSCLLSCPRRALQCEQLEERIRTLAMAAGTLQQPGASGSGGGGSSGGGGAVRFDGGGSMRPPPPPPPAAPPPPSSRSLSRPVGFDMV